MIHKTSGIALPGIAGISAAATLSIVAGYIHLLVMPEHFAEWWGYDVVFLVIALAQIAYGGVLLLRPIRPVFVAGIVGTGIVILLWVWTRTVGIPLLGPGAGKKEAIATIDLAAKAVKLALVVLLVALMREDTLSPMTGDGQKMRREGTQ